MSFANKIKSHQDGEFPNVESEINSILAYSKEISNHDVAWLEVIQSQINFSISISKINSKKPIIEKQLSELAEKLDEVYRSTAKK